MLTCEVGWQRAHDTELLRIASKGRGGAPHVRSARQTLGAWSGTPAPRPGRLSAHTVGHSPQDSLQEPLWEQGHGLEHGMAKLLGAESVVPGVCPRKARLAANGFSARWEDGHGARGPSPHREGPCRGPRPGLGGHMTCHQETAQDPRQARRPPISLSATLAALWFLSHLFGRQPPAGALLLHSLQSAPASAFKQCVDGCAERRRDDKQRRVLNLSAPGFGAFPPAEAGPRGGRGHRASGRPGSGPAPAPGELCLLRQVPRLLWIPELVGTKYPLLYCCVRRAAPPAERAGRPVVVPRGLVSLDDPTFSPYLLPPTANETCRS